MIINKPNESVGYDPRKNGIQACINEYRYQVGEMFAGERVMRLEYVVEFVKSLGAKILGVAGEGSLVYKNSRYYDSTNKGFFMGSYFGENGVYELVIQKV